MGRRQMVGLALGAAVLAACSVAPRPTTVVATAVVVPEAPPLATTVPPKIIRPAPATPEPRTPTLGPPGIPVGVMTAALPTRPAGATEALARAQQLPAGRDREDMVSLLTEAERVVDEAERYQTYLGAWRYLFKIYERRGAPLEQRVVLDAIKAVARTFPQYEPQQFEIPEPTVTPTAEPTDTPEPGGGG